MSSPEQPSATPLYRSFRELRSASFRTVMRFVEDHTRDISLLPVHEYFALQYGYVAALHQAGHHARVAELTEELLEVSIVHNLREVDGEQAFEVLLYRRADAFFHLAEYRAATHVATELVRLQPDDPEAVSLLERTLYQRYNPWVARLRQLSVVLFLVAASLIAFEVLVIHNFFSGWSDGFELARNVSFVVGWSVLLGADVGHRSWAWWRVRGLRARARAARSLREKRA